MSERDWIAEHRTAVEGKPTRDQLIEQGRKQAERTARRVYKSYEGKPEVDLQDLIAEAYAALVVAADTYDPDQNTRFTTWVYKKVESQLRRYISSFLTTIRVPEYKDRMIRSIHGRANEMVQELQREPSIDDIASDPKLLSEHPKLTREDVIDALHTGRPIVLLENYAEDHQPVGAPEPPSETLQSVLTAMENLPKMEKEVIQLRHGINCDPLSQEDIAARFGVSRRQIVKVERVALAKLRHPSNFK